MEVIKLEPAIKTNIWGGNYFQQFGKGVNEVRAAECWELSMFPGSSSIIVSGENKGKTLEEVLTEKDVGPIQKKFPYFPILIKLIDARDNLSIQVHPSDEYALKNENSFGKSEMWYILSADEGAGLYVGFNDNYSKEEIEKRLKDSTILETLNFFKVKPGECYMINPGTIHAIGAGVRLIEIQQNSNLTYRLYDYLRKDDKGNYRELHIEKALKVIDYTKFTRIDSEGEILQRNKYFTVRRVEVKSEYKVTANGDSFKSFTFLSGKGTVNGIPYNQYDTFFVPYGKEAVIKGDGVIVISEVEDL